jgi:hypothetical protein
MDHLLEFELFENLNNSPSMKTRIKNFRKLIQGKLSPDDVANKDEFTFKIWKEKIEDLKKFLDPKSFTEEDASDMLYANPEFYPDFIKIKKK